MSGEAVGTVLVGVLIGAMLVITTFRALRGIFGGVASTPRVLEARKRGDESEQPQRPINAFQYVRGILAGALFAAINLFGFVATNRILFFALFLCGIAIIVSLTVLRVSKRQ